MSTDLKSDSAVEKQDIEPEKVFQDSEDHEIKYNTLSWQVLILRLHLDYTLNV
jgi:hypothetical protein